MSDRLALRREQTPAAYEELLVPPLFRPWAQRIAGAVPLRDGQRVLDVACGTGILAREIAGQAGFRGSVTGLDVNPGMLVVAERAAPHIEWHAGNAESMPFGDRSFDAVVSQFGLMLFDDPVVALEETWRVLSPGGHLVVAVFDRLERNPTYATMASIFQRRAGASVGDTLRFPFSLGDAEHLGSLFADAAIAPVAVRTEAVPLRFSSPRNMVMSDVNGWFPFAGIYLEDDVIDAVVEAAAEELAGFITSDGGVEFESRAHIVTATKRRAVR